MEDILPFSLNKIQNGKIITAIQIPEEQILFTVTKGT